MDNDEFEAGGSGRKGYYSFDKLEVYHLAVKFREIVKRIIAELPPHLQDDAKQLNRSSKSSVRNVCEGSGEFKPLEKARFYRIALRSAQESGGTLRLIEADTKRSALIDEAHSINTEFIAKITVMIKNKTKRRP